MDVLLTFLLFVPLGMALWLANLAWRKRIEGEVRSEKTLKWLSYGVLAVTFGLLILIGLMLQGVGLLASLVPGSDAALSSGGIPADALQRVALGFWLPSIFGLVMLLRPPRRLVSRFVPIDPANPVHAVALSMAFLILVNLFITLGLGLNNLADMLEASQELGVESNPAPALWAQNTAFVLLSLVGVGWLARRTLAVALNRLAVRIPSLPQVLLGIGAGVLMVPLIVFLELLASKIGLGASPDVERLTEQLVGPLTLSIPGVLTLGLAAGLGEESVFRGALHPRFGLFLTSVLFALLHSQYGFSFSTVAVFLVGLLLGVIRQRTNTTTAMIMHAVYNMTLGLISYLGLMQNL